MKMAASVSFVLFCLAMTPSTLSLLANGNANVEDLLRLITDEKRYRATLQNEMDALRNDIVVMKARHQNCKWCFS